jgi:hypothetical protein
MKIHDKDEQIQTDRCLIAGCQASKIQNRMSRSTNGPPFDRGLPGVKNPEQDEQIPDSKFIFLDLSFLASI